MMGRIILFTSWAGLLVAALFSAYYTGKLQNIDRNAVAIVKMVSGRVFQRPENYSVYEIINKADRVFDGDYISTGAGAKAEVQLLNSKTIMIGENSLIQLSFSVDDDGLGSDIVTLLKGAVSSKAETFATKTTPKKLSFKVGKSSLQHIDTSTGVEISKNLEQAEASIKVVAGSAQIVGDDNVIKEITKDETIVVTAAKIPLVETVQNPVIKKELPVEVPVIKAAPQVIAMNDSKIMTAPANLNAESFAANTLVEDTVLLSAPEKLRELPTPKVESLQPESTVDKSATKELPVKKLKKLNAVVPTTPLPKPVKVASIPKSVQKSKKSYSFILFKSKPEVFVGSGIYFVKNQTLYGKVVGKPSQSNLISLAKKHNVAFYYEGNAEAFLGSADKKNLTKKTVVYAVDRNGIQKIDAALIRTRPAALDLLRKSGYSVFDEEVNVLSVGH